MGRNFPLIFVLYIMMYEVLEVLRQKMKETIEIFFFIKETKSNDLLKFLEKK